MNPSTTINPQQNPSLYENKQGWNILKSGAQMIPTSITSDNLSQVIPIQLPTQPPPTDVGNIVTSNNYGIATGLTGFSIDQNGQFVPQPVPTVPTDQTKQEDTGTTGRLGNLRALLGLAPKQQDVFSNPDVVAKNAVVEQRQQEVNNATAQLNAITARQQQAQLMLNNRLDKETGLSSEQKKLQRDTEMAKINYEAAIEALPVQASIAAAQGNLALAQQSLDNLTRIKTEKATNDYNYQKSLYDSISGFVDKEEQRTLDRLNKENDRKYQETKDLIDYQAKALKTANENHAPLTVIQGIKNATSKIGVNEALGIYDKSDLKTQVIDLPNGSKALINSQTGAVIKSYGDSSDTSGIDANTLAYAQQYAATGQIPSGLPKGTFGKVAEAAKSLPKPDGTLVDINTGVKSSKTPASLQEGYGTMYSVVQLANQLKELDTKRYKGLVSGTIGKVFGAEDQQRYVDLRSQISDLLARARTGAAINTDEEARYFSLLPGRWSNSFFLGASSQSRIDNFIKTITSDLNNKLSTQGLSIYGFSTVDIDGQKYKVGDTIESTDNNGNVIKGRINPDKTITLI